MLSPRYNGPTYNFVLDYFKKGEQRRIRRFMCAALPHRRRILSLRLRCDDLKFDVLGEEGPISAYEFLWGGSMVKLESLDVELGRWTWEGMKAVRSNNCTKELHLRGPWTRSCMPLFSTNLKLLVITNYRARFSRIVDALQATPSLISLTLSDVKFAIIEERIHVTLG